MRPLIILLACLFLTHSPRAVAAEEFLPGVHRIVFLGDSITQSGQYVDDFEAFLFTEFPARKFEVINVGLSSETVSGLSEPNHADGKFPRPDLHERLDRVLAKTKPDLVFACYGMNDGIYLPLDEERFAKFREGMSRLREKCAAAGAQIIHLTPPVFDPGPHPKTEFNYNDVLDRYSAWLLEQRANGWRVIDVHGAMKEALAKHRATDPEFRFAKDGVHPDAAGHLVMAIVLIDALAPTESAHFRNILESEWARTPGGNGWFDAVRKRERILGDAWLADAGHLRPGAPKALPIEQAKTEAAELEKTIRDTAPPPAP